MDKFQNRYRIPSARLQTWDYRWAGAYFITICTAHRMHYFGEIENGKMILSQVGVIANVLWYEISNHSKNVELGAFVVMPNHIHGILVLTDNNKDGDIGGDIDGNIGGGILQTGHALSLQIPPTPQTPQPTEQSKTIGKQRFQNIGKNSLSSILGSYKSAVTKNANRMMLDHEWQSRFHDHIIRTYAEYQHIVNYINTNPENWEEDEFFTSEEL